MQKELLRMENIVKTFPGVKALNNAAITVHAGEVMGFMGENGAGKSTLMNVLGGVFPADSGSIHTEKSGPEVCEDSSPFPGIRIHRSEGCSRLLPCSDQLPACFSGRRRSVLSSRLFSVFPHKPLFHSAYGFLPVSLLADPPYHPADS